MTQPTESAVAVRSSSANANLTLAELLHRPWVMELLLAAGTFLLYCGTLAFQFVWDDRMQILDNASIRSWKFAPHYFTGNVWALIDRTANANYYRPLFLLWLRVNHALFGYQPMGWHALCLGLHVAATVLAYRLFHRLLRSDGVAAGAAVLFAVHPVHVESAAWVSGATDSMVAMFLLGSVLAFLGYIDARESQRNGTKLYVVSLACAACALLSKEIAVMLPLLLVPTALAARTEKTSSRQIGLATIPYFGLIAVYLAVRHWALQGFSHPNPAISTLTLVITWPSVLVFYARQLFAPFWIRLYADVHWVTVATARDFWVPLALCVAMLAAGFWAWKRSSERSLLFVAYAWIVFPILPALYLKVFAPLDLVHDRYLYVSCIGLALLVALAVRAIQRANPGSIRILKPAASAGLLLLATLSFNNQIYWASDLLLFKRALDLSPGNDAAALNLGIMYAEHNRPDLAEPLLKGVSERNPKSAPAAQNYAHLLFLSQRNGEAEKYFQRALADEPDHDTWWVEYAAIELKLGKLQEADQAILHALSLNGDRSEFHVIHGLILSESGNRMAAEQEYRKALQIDPNDEGAKRGLESLQSPAK